MMVVTGMIISWPKNAEANIAACVMVAVLGKAQGALARLLARASNCSS